ncbi:hypothetical protein SAMN04489841_4455 [Natrinema salaciae]|uniref:Uncharacterized protein n=1 Tax=Natrinema salaciae TaxID=1186196 RepID=A0A1H9RM21_9EURY|nr:hypothetical protein SAMN04489841_4455 [Natrinema salaciae]
MTPGPSGQYPLSAAARSRRTGAAHRNGIGISVCGSLSRFDDRPTTRTGRDGSRRFPASPIRGITSAFGLTTSTTRPASLAVVRTVTRWAGSNGYPRRRPSQRWHSPFVRSRLRFLGISHRVRTRGRQFGRSRRRTRVGERWIPSREPGVMAGTCPLEMIAMESPVNDELAVPDRSIPGATHPEEAIAGPPRRQQTPSRSSGRDASTLYWVDDDRQVGRRPRLAIRGPTGCPRGRPGSSQCAADRGGDRPLEGSGATPEIRRPTDVSASRSTTVAGASIPFGRVAVAFAPRTCRSSRRLWPD